MALTDRATRKKYTGNMQIYLLIRAMPIMHSILLRNWKPYEKNRKKPVAHLFIMPRTEKN